MKVRIWGGRGSIPSPLKPTDIREKIRYAILNLPDIDTQDPKAVDAYLDSMSPLRSGTVGGNTTCVEIQTDHNIFIIDAGSGLRELGEHLMKGPCGKGEGKLTFFFTHAHWDHIQGFPFFAPGFVPGNKITIYSVHDMKYALESQQNQLNFPVPLSIMQADLEFIRIQADTTLTIDDVQISNLKTNHPGDAYAYRFTDNYSTFVFASDAEYKKLDEANLRPFIEFYKNADALIFDTQYTLREGLQKIDWGHSSAMIGADIARMAGVKKLVLFHHDPTYSDEQLLDIQQRTHDYQLQDTVHATCEVLVGYEGLTFDLTPSGTVRLQYLVDENSAVLTPTGNFDEAGITQLETQLDQLKEKGWPARLVLDLSRTETLTIAGLKTLVSLRKDEPDTAIALAALPSSVRQVIDLAGLLDYFAIYPTVQAALTGLQASASLNLTGQLVHERYQVESRLHDSWRGTVFKATDIQANKSVTINLLSTSLGEKTISYFLSQAERLANLAHPNITQILDYGQDETLSYVIEDHVEAPSLRDVMAKNGAKPLFIKEARKISLNLINALEYTHSRGIIHYNLAPRNILLAEQTILTNFGLDSLVENRPLFDNPLIGLEAPYLAPEQILGQSPDARTDLYALGVIMYEMFTGQKPFQGDDQQVMQAHLHQLPYPPRDLNPDLSRSLEHLILKLLEKDADERYATAHQTHQILRNLIISDAEDSNFSSLLYAHTRPLLGRKEQLKEMQSLWKTVQQTSTPNLLVVQGEMGIGKSRLVAEFLSRHVDETGATALVGRCDEFGLPYTPYAEILSTVFNRGLVDPNTIADHTGYLIRQIPVLDAILSPYHTAGSNGASYDAQQAQWHFFGTVMLVLAKLGPTVLFLEDATYLDETSVALTRFLIRRARLPLMIVATDRADEDTPSWLNGFQTKNRQTINLTPLPVSAVKTFLQDLMGGQIPQTVVNTVNKRSHGNPYFIEEISRHLIDKRTFVKQENDQWLYKPDGVTAALPPSLLKLFTERVEKLAESRQIQKLTDSARQALSVAAIIGTEFNFDNWVAVLGGEEQADMALDALDEAVGLRLVRQVGPGHYSFDPVDIADVLTESLTDSEQQEFHYQAAKALSQGNENPILISQHFEEAGLPAQAAHYLKMAAEKAKRAHAVNEAICYYVQAIRFVESQDCYEALGELYLQQGAAHESIEAFNDALALAQSAEDVVGQARILNGLALTSWIYDLYEDAQYAASAALALDGTPVIEQATAQSHLGMIAWIQGRLNEAQNWCEKSAELLDDRGDPLRLGGVYNRLGLAYLSKGNLRKATVAFSKSLETRRKCKDYWGQAYCLNNLGKVAIEEGDFDQATQLLSSAQRQFEEIDSPDGLMVVHINRGRLFLRQKNPLRALPLLLKALDVSKKLTKPNAYYLGDAYLLIAEASLMREDYKRGKAATKEALQIVEMAGNQEHIATAQLILARICAEEGLDQDASAYFQAAINAFDVVGSPIGLIRTKLDYAQFLNGHNEGEDGKALRHEALEEAQHLGLSIA
ncbi:MAG: protein kinase [Chloroflexota bacterium]